MHRNTTRASLKKRKKNQQPPAGASFFKASRRIWIRGSTSVTKPTTSQHNIKEPPQTVNFYCSQTDASTPTQHRSSNGGEFGRTFDKLSELVSTDVTRPDIASSRRWTVRRDPRHLRRAIEQRDWKSASPGQRRLVSQSCDHRYWKSTPSAKA